MFCTFIICFSITITKFLCWWSIINHLLSTAMKTLNLKYFGVTILIFTGHVTSSITWPFDSACVVFSCWSIVTMHLSCTVMEISKILGSRPWPFVVTWCHRSRDHRTRRGHFPVGGQWWPCVYLARIRRYRALKILGSLLEFDLLGHVTSSVTWPLDSANVVFYWWSIVTMRLTFSVTEI